jgi:GTP-binding protein
MTDDVRTDGANRTTRDDLRNVAIVAHVDHGKTTLVDAMLRQTGAFGDHQEVAERVMDSGDLEREKGITILAKNTSVTWSGTTINVVDTPGHADFGGEVERALTMVDGVVLLVDAAEGPLPQTRFVVRKALARDLPVILVINKVDRPDARVEAVVDEVYELFLDIDAADHQIDFPIVYCAARDGWASLEPGQTGTDLEPLFKLLVEHIPPPSFEDGHPLQAWVTNIDADPYVGRLALCRVVNGTLTKGRSIGLSRVDGSVDRVRLAELYLTEHLERIPAESAGPGDLVAIAGVEDIMIGETLVDPEDPRPLPVIEVDQPALSMTLGPNSSPLAGEDGDKLTARLIRNRLDSELVGNVSLRVTALDGGDYPAGTVEVQARGELQLAVLVEQMRREGFELTVGKPQVVTKDIDGKRHEPVERVTIDVPEEHLGTVTQLLASRKGRMESMTNHGTGWIRLDFLVPARGLIGFRTEFLTETRGSGVLNHTFEGFEPWFGELRTRPTGSVVADRRGPVTAYAVIGIQERSELVVGPGTEVYCGMIVGENSRSEDMDVNICKEKQLTNHRAAAADQTVKLTPPREMSLEQALEFIADDECVEVTPDNIRLRKVALDPIVRARMAKERKAARTA